MFPFYSIISMADCVVRGLSTFSSGLLCVALLHCQNNNDGSGKTFVFATQSILLFSNSDGRDSTLQTHSNPLTQTSPQNSLHHFSQQHPDRQQTNKALRLTDIQNVMRVFHLLIKTLSSLQSDVHVSFDLEIKLKALFVTFCTLKRKS